MTKTLLELARTVVKFLPNDWEEDGLKDCESGSYYRQSQIITFDPKEQGKVIPILDTLNAHFMLTEDERQDIGEYVAAANPKRIIELCEAIEKLIHSIEVHTHVASDNAPDTCAECGQNIRAQAHRYVGEPSKEVQQREAIAFARRALNGE